MVYEHFAAVVESFLHRDVTFFPGSPNFKKTWWVEIATNPLTPTSTVNNRGFQGVCWEMFWTKGIYLLCFLNWAAWIPSSAGQVSSRRITVLSLSDQIKISGRSALLNISGGKTKFSFGRSAKIFQSFPLDRRFCLADSVENFLLIFVDPALTKAMLMFLSTTRVLCRDSMCSLKAE